MQPQKREIHITNTDRMLKQKQSRWLEQTSVLGLFQCSEWISIETHSEITLSMTRPFPHQKEKQNYFYLTWSEWIQDPSKLQDKKESVDGHSCRFLYSVCVTLPASLSQGRSANPAMAALQYSPSHLLLPDQLQHQNWALKRHWRGKSPLHSLSCFSLNQPTVTSQGKSFSEEAKKTNKQKQKMSLKSAYTHIAFLQMCNRNLTF